MKGLIGTKYTQISVFTTNQLYIPVTVIKLEPNYLIEQKTIEKNKYCAAKLATVPKKKHLVRNSEAGRYQKLQIPVQKYEKEMRNWSPKEKLGSEIKPSDVFKVNDIVDVVGISKGKGTAGPIKRHNFACGPKSHGSHYHRNAGSLGSIVSNRVFKNKKNAGRMGHQQVTIKNLQIIAINEKHKYLIVSGLIPGAKKQIVYIHEAQGARTKKPIELNNFLLANKQKRTVDVKLQK